MITSDWLACVMVGVVGAVLASSTAYYASINTGVPGTTCRVRSLSAHELELLFFRDQAFRYTRDLMVWGAFKNDTEGALLYLSQRDNKDFLKHLHELYEPVEVSIQNNSDAPVVVPRTNYIKAYGHAAVVAEELVKRYPGFKKHTVLASLYAAGLGVVALPFALILAFCAAASFTQLKGEILGTGLVIGALATFIPMAIAASFAGRARALHKKYEHLKSLAPTIKNAQGVKTKLAQTATYTIPPHSQFTDIFILYRPQVLSAALKNNQICTTL
ncbi:MAG: hypothetical protein WCJ17_02840 [bacterium]